MEGNDKVEALEEIDQNIVELISSDTETPTVDLPSSDKCNTIVLPKHRNRPKNATLELTKLQSSTSKRYIYIDSTFKNRFRLIQSKPLSLGASSLEHESCEIPSTLNKSALTPNSDSKLKFKNRSRAIRPKSFSPGASSLEHKSRGIPTTLNKPTLTPNVTVPIQDETSDDSSKTDHCVTVDNNDTKCETISKAHKNSIELFFASMAQSVLDLPREVQANIKMQICEIVTEAELLNHRSMTD